VIHRAGEKMHIEDEQHATRFAEASGSEPNTSRVHELRRRSLVTVLGH
jgi:ribosomal protein L29